MRNNKGFTLVELLAVIVIMGILMLVAIPSITRTIENSRKDTFVDIAKSYGNAARTLWTSDNLTCDGTVSSAVDDGDYYILINSKETARDKLPTLVDQGGKSSWGNRNVNGYVRVNISTTLGEDVNNDGVYEVEPRRITNFYVALSDGTHGIIDDDLLIMDKLKRENVVMNLSNDNIKQIELTTDDGKLNCFKTNRGIYYCLNVAPIKDISGICVDNSASVESVGNIEINPVNFENDDWITTVVALKSGDHPYRVGDVKSVDMGEFGMHTIRLSNLKECDGSLESQTACGVVLEFADVITNYKINDTHTSVGGWPVTKMRKYLNTKIYNALPSELRSGIIISTVVSGHGSNDTNNFITKDRIYLLSAPEVWKDGTTNKIGYESSLTSTRQLDYYQEIGVLTDNVSGAVKMYNGSNSWWWLRSAYSYNDGNFFSARNDGYWTARTSALNIGVSPAFRIA